MSAFLDTIKARAREDKKTIVLPESMDRRTFEAAETILKEDTLIIIDNVSDIDIIKGLKTFGSEHSKYHIIAITSKKEKLSEFKGEELQFKSMNVLDFEEYLWAQEEKSLSELIREYGASVIRLYYAASGINGENTIYTHDFSGAVAIVVGSEGKGLSRLVKPMSLGAAAVGADGVMIEVHNNPQKALCDGPQSLTPAQFEDVMKAVKGVLAAL